MSRSVRDFTTLAWLVGGYTLTAFVPRRADRWIVARLATLAVPIRRSWVSRVERRMRSALAPHRPEIDFQAQALESAHAAVEEHWLRFRALHDRPPLVSTCVRGLDRVEHALSHGRGVILWAMDFGGSLRVKLALQRAGLALVHLGSATHGISYPPTRIGMKWTAPLYRATEDRFLEERVMIPAEGSPGYMRTLLERLGQNRCVFIEGANPAIRGNETTTLLGKEQVVATGAPSLAWATECSLLTATAHRDGLLQYRVEIGPPISPDRGDGKKAFVRDAIAEYQRRFEAALLADPGDWPWASPEKYSWLTGHDRDRSWSKAPRA